MGLEPDLEKSSIASTAVLPAVSLTPGRYPTQMSQSKSWARGLKEDSSVMGFVKILIRAASICSGVSSASMVRMRITRISSTAMPK